jgi:hypothetical protein
MSVAMRREVEARIIMSFVRACLAKGYKLSVSLERGYDHEEMVEAGVLGTTDFSKIMTEAFAGDECHIFVHKSDEAPVENGQMNSIGYAYFVFGNDGWDVLSDYLTTLDTLGVLDEAQKIADRYGEAPTWDGLWWDDIPQFSANEVAAMKAALQ